MRTKFTSIVLSLFVILSCDQFREDFIPTGKQITFNKTEYYILPGSSVVIDLRTIIDHSFIKATLEISENPVRGQLTQLEDLLLKYEPGSEFTQGNDTFTLSLQSDGETVSNEAIYFIVKPSIEDLPCALFAIQDKVAPQGQASIVIDFLANDRICGVDSADLEMSIYKRPSHGNAILSGEEIIYEPEAGFVGEDEIMYQLRQKGRENEIASGQNYYSFGLISISFNPNPEDDESPMVDCDGKTRPLVAAQLVPVGELSSTRGQMVAASAGGKILFGGGYSVDVFDISANTWSVKEFSSGYAGVPRVAVLNNKIFLAEPGGWGQQPSKVHVYDASSDAASTIVLPHNINRELIDVGAAAGDKVVFLSGGPTNPKPPEYVTYTFAEIYDPQTNLWRTDTLYNRTHSRPENFLNDAGIAATVIGEKIYFAGNGSDWYAWDIGLITSPVDVFDASANSWSSSNLSMARGWMAAIAVDGKNYWAGGLYSQPQLDHGPFTNLVEIRDERAGLSTFGCLFQPNAFFSAVSKDNKIVFFTTGNKVATDWYVEAPHIANKFDIYDIATDTWSIGVLPVNIHGASIISVNNTIYVAGGFVDGVLSRQVWKLEF